MKLTYNHPMAVAINIDNNIGDEKWFTYLLPQFKRKIPSVMYLLRI